MAEVESIVRTMGLLYGFFISAPQQHLGFDCASTDAVVTLIWQPQRRFVH